VLIASSLLLLAVVGAMLAFDAWPDNAAAETDVVAIHPADRMAESGAGTSEQASTARAADDRRSTSAGDRVRAADTRLPKDAARAASVQVAADSDALVKDPPPADPVVTELPAPDSADGSRPVTAPAPSPSTPAPEAPAPEAPKHLPTPGEVLPDANDEAVGLTAVTAPIADSLSPVSPLVGITVRGSGERIDGTLAGVVEAADGR
jgi:hypothetical protein